VNVKSQKCYKNCIFLVVIANYIAVMYIISIHLRRKTNTTHITETKIVAHINRQLKNVLNRLVKGRLDGILEGLPVDELVGETRNAESYR